MDACGVAKAPDALRGRVAVVPAGSELEERLMYAPTCPLCGCQWWCCGETMCPQPKKPK